ncbi:MAG: DinB family protein [Bacteroidota bacterium]
MENATQLSRRFRDVFLDGKWIANTNYQELLADLNYQQATTKIGALNSIALLTFHIDYYLGGVLQVLQGGELTIRDKFSFECPPIESEADWHQLRKGLLDHAETFAQIIETLTEEQLSQPFVREEYGNYWRNIEGMIEHGYYHLGQISLLKKLVIGDS